MKQFPLVSVIIPTHNRDRTISRALNSVLNQTYKNIELIVVDDASTDNTAVVVGSFNDERIIYIRLDNRSGANAARNVGISVAKGEYIAFQDSDDEWLLEKLERQLEAICSAREEFKIVYTGYFRFKSYQAFYLPKQDNRIKTGYILKSLLQGNFITTQSLLIHKSVFDDLGVFDPGLDRLQDWELLIRMAEKYKLLYLDSPLLIAYFSDDSITSKAHLLPAAMIYIYQKHLQLIRKNKLESAFQSQIAKTYIKSGMLKNAYRWLFKSLKSKFFRFETWALFTFCLLGVKSANYGIHVVERLKSIHVIKS